MLLLPSSVLSFFLLEVLLLCEAAFNRHRRLFLGYPRRRVFGGVHNRVFTGHRGNFGRGMHGGIGRSFQPRQGGIPRGFQPSHRNIGRGFDPKYQKALRGYQPPRGIGYQQTYQRTQERFQFSGGARRSFQQSYHQPGRNPGYRWVGNTGVNHMGHQQELGYRGGQYQNSQFRVMDQSGGRSSAQGLPRSSSQEFGNHYGNLGRGLGLGFGRGSALASALSVNPAAELIGASPTLNALPANPEAPTSEAAESPGTSSQITATPKNSEGGGKGSGSGQGSSSYNRANSYGDYDYGGDIFSDYLTLDILQSVFSGTAEVVGAAAQVVEAKAMQMQEAQSQQTTQYTQAQSQQSQQNTQSQSCTAEFAYTASNGAAVYKCDCSGSTSYQYYRCVPPT
ncbi:unnamed protein product [Cylicocyclus nassatus]|uniref:Uncharacterized protein n=1 Tax=Cylicocyclus nassatus TaxID=53992 RepID=A0AA36GZ75_CYLNA|nr:unnamed protein product [Cylicocyclus nassatus]